MARPFGISLLTVLFALSGIFVLAKSIVDLDTILRPGLIPAILLGNILIPLISICAAYGLWMRLSWGWLLAAVLATSSVFFLLAQFVWVGIHSIVSVAPILWKLIIPLVIAGYLLRSSLIETFGWNKTEVVARRTEALSGGLLLVSIGLITTAFGLS